MHKIATTLVRPFFFTSFLAIACSDAPPDGSFGGERSCQQDADCPVGFTCNNLLCTAVGRGVSTDAGRGGGSNAPVAPGVPDAGSSPSTGPIDSPPASAPSASGPTPIGERCRFDSDCATGICLESRTRGPVCTVNCTFDCPTGWGCRHINRGNGITGAICYPSGDLYCARCDTRLACPAAGDECTNLGGATFCTQSCAARGCDPGFDCRDVNPDGNVVDPSAGRPANPDGGVSRQCIPVGGLCPGCIDPDGDGYGIGAGCRGKDCDETNPLIHEGAVEICDRKDNNCNGETDEGFDLQSSVATCGACDVACTNAHGSTACRSGHCVPTCAAGFGDCDGDVRNGCETDLRGAQFCGACTDDASCPSGFFCSQGVCERARPPAGPCTSSSQCVSGFCADGVCCNEACVGACRACNLANHVGTCTLTPNGDDPENECTDEGAAMCGNDGFCDGRGACRKYVAGVECAPQSCVQGVQTDQRVCDGAGGCQPTPPRTTTCGPYQCGGATCRVACNSDNDCIPTHACANGGCKLRNGETCSAASECASGFCVDGVCCNADCAGACRACNLATARGTCTSYTDGTDPENECAATPAATCGTDGACNGQGACRNWGASAVCAPESCANGVRTIAGRCDGQGHCGSGGTTTTASCGGYACNATGTGCRTSCGNDADCVDANYYCSAGGRCLPRVPLGQSCTSDRACQGGKCCGGICRDLQSDESNCGACGAVCQNPAGTTSCIAGACAPVCLPNVSYDLDGNKANGCECSGGAYEPNDTCAAAVDVTPVSVFTPGGLHEGQNVMVRAKLVPNGDADWFKVRLVDNFVPQETNTLRYTERFGVRVRLEGIPSGVDYDLYVYKNTCPKAQACASDLDCIATGFEACRAGQCVVKSSYCNGVNCAASTRGAGSNECVRGWIGSSQRDDSATFLIEVRWYAASAANTCFDYSLTVENTQAPCP